MDRLLRAPVNLYHEITPIGRILGYFQDDIHAFNSHFFGMILEVAGCNLQMILIFVKSLYAVPQLLPVFVYFIYVSYRNKQIHTKAVDT